MAWATVASHSQKPRRHKLEHFLLKWEARRRGEMDVDFEDDDEPDADDDGGYQPSYT